MIQWISDVLDAIAQTVTLTTDALTTFLGLIESNISALGLASTDVASGSGSLNFRLWIGTFRYVVGDTIFGAFYTLSMVGLGYVLFHLVRMILDVIFQSLGGLKNVFLRG